MKKSNKTAWMMGLAFSYARSGNYENWSVVELKLAGDGFAEARSVLTDVEIRKET